eukprot:755698-Hanusia_phi.AAC.2
MQDMYKVASRSLHIPRPERGEEEEEEEEQSYLREDGRFLEIAGQGDRLHTFDCAGERTVSKRAAELPGCHPERLHHALPFHRNLSSGSKVDGADEVFVVLHLLVDQACGPLTGTCQVEERGVAADERRKV